ncbi:MAG: precorrin-6A/cobalt-precorrin-6A reductase [Clostridiales bacterium]
MTSILLFGGTTEGRQLCDFLRQKGIEATVCVASAYGEEQITAGANLQILAQRLDKAAMVELIRRERPRLVIDATHPYATEVSRNIREACREAQAGETAASLPAASLPSPSGAAEASHANAYAAYVRVLRQKADTALAGCRCCGTLEEIIAHLNQREDKAFIALGAKEAAALTNVKNFDRRLYLRILPALDSLEGCLRLGYPAKHLICMQGPFSEELNRAMFRETQAAILVTKESGPSGGFQEKVAAAQALGMEILLWSRAGEEEGCSLSEVMARIEETR